MSDHGGFLGLFPAWWFANGWASKLGRRLRDGVRRVRSGWRPVLQTAKVGYMSLEEQVDADFGRARRGNTLRRVKAYLRHDPASERLPCFEEVRRTLGASNRVHLGRRVVRVEEIGGSVGRCSQFDRVFFPNKPSLGTRWKRIDRAFHRGEVLPPVSLYKIGDSYFVLDGNHRVSVARYQGVETIDAEVTEFYVRLPENLESLGS